MSALLRAVNKISYALFLQLYFLIRLPFPLMVLQLLFSLFLFDPKCSRNGNHLTTWDILYKAHHMVSCMPLDSVQLITGQGKAEQISLICISITFFCFWGFLFLCRIICRIPRLVGCRRCLNDVLACLFVCVRNMNKSKRHQLITNIHRENRPPLPPSYSA